MHMDSEGKGKRNESTNPARNRQTDEAFAGGLALRLGVDSVVWLVLHKISLAHSQPPVSHSHSPRPFLHVVGPPSCYYRQECVETSKTVVYMGKR